MARKLKPVDDTPICDRAYVRRIDPVWMLGRVPLHFWLNRSHRRDYLLWLGNRLRYRGAADWYAVTVRDFECNRGEGMLVRYGYSPIRALKELVPERDWCEWKFKHVPRGFWRVKANRHRYLCWLGKELGFRRPQDWYGIRVRDIDQRNGTGLRDLYPCYIDLMREYLPKLDWDRFKKRGGPLSEEQVLDWAKATFESTGRLPKTNDGPIAQSPNDTWKAVDAALRIGNRGLPGGTTLAKLLKKHFDFP